MGDVFREIDEELRQERYEKLWQAYGKYAIGGGVALIILIVGWVGWNNFQKSQRQAESVQFAAATRLLEEGKKDDAAALFANLADRAGDGYRILSRFHQAALRADGGDIAGAISLYDALAAESGLAPLYRDAATVFSVSLAIDQPDADIAALSARLDPLMEADGPWRHAAREYRGLLAIKAGDTQKARELFKQLADDLTAPAAMRGRAAEVLAVLSD